MHRSPIAVIAALTFSAGIARADEVTLDVVFADTFDANVATVYRFGAFELRDPHVFYQAFGCLDVTDDLNTDFEQALGADDDGDGYYDASPVLVMKPLADDGAPHAIASENAQCTVASPSQCSPAEAPGYTGWYESYALTDPDVCLGTLPDTTSGYLPAVPTPGGHCLATTTADATLSLGEVSVPLYQTRFATPWPATDASTTGGLVRGFLRESDADAIMIDLGVATVPMSSLLPDGTGSCAVGVTNGKDMLDDVPGWWMYLEFRLDPATQSGF